MEPIEDEPEEEDQGEACAMYPENPADLSILEPPECTLHSPIENLLMPSIPESTACLNEEQRLRSTASDKGIMYKLFQKRANEARSKATLLSYQIRLAKAEGKTEESDKLKTQMHQFLSQAAKEDAKGKLYLKEFHDDQKILREKFNVVMSLNDPQFRRDPSYNKSYNVYDQLGIGR